MAKKGKWLIAVGSSENPLDNNWVREQPGLLDGWPVGKKTPSGIRQGDELVYYAAHHQKLIALARSKGSGSDAQDSLDVQVRHAIPVIAFAPDWRVIGKPPEAIVNRNRKVHQFQEANSAPV